jgi:phospholipase/carboxylesterase
MNRIHAWGKSHENPAASSMATAGALVTSGERGGLYHSLFVPLHYERNYAYPLLVWLHGPGDNEHQLRRVMPLASMRNYVGVAPRGTSAAAGAAGAASGFAWRQDECGVARAEQYVRECIELARQSLNIAPGRIFLAGHECGGTTALRVALRAPRDFAGAISLGGAFPDGGQPLARLNEARQLSMLLIQGRDSRNYSTSHVCRHLRLFHSAGMSVTLRQYPCGDEMTTLMLRDMDAWIMEQVTGVASSSDAACYRDCESN